MHTFVFWHAACNLYLLTGYAKRLGGKNLSSVSALHDADLLDATALYILQKCASLRVHVSDLFHRFTKKWHITCVRIGTAFAATNSK